ncbi:MAG: VWA domain-containing protein [Nitrospirae bacterium]|nr:VWA domain-containing protein [Nitrospirota bacterium]MCL5237653.1 VWA domain-containing protein [Nitrospirota bacterium]
MKTIKALFFIFIVSCFLSAASAENIPAGKSKSNEPVKSGQKASSSPEAKKSPSGNFDVMLLIDSSGSMRKTDPRDYRKAAARLFISLMGTDDRVGVVSFGDTAKTLIPPTQNTVKNRQRLFDAVNKISSKEFSTHIQDGVKKGYEEIKASTAAGKVLILMSDGKLTLGSKEKEDAAHAELSRLLPELPKSGIKLYSVAFTEMSDAKLLESMARETGGFFKLASTDKDLHVIFTSIFEKIKSPDTVPLEDNTFGIDKDIQEVILVISKKPGTSTVIVDPSNKKHTPAQYAKNMQWYGSKIFDMITIKEPAVGKWKVNLSTREGNKVFVITNLSLKSSFDKGFVNKGDKLKIDAWLEKDGGPLKEKDVLDQITFFAEITGPDGKTGRLNLTDSGDGKYVGELSAGVTGDYTLKIAAEGKTFKREKNFQFKAVEHLAGQKASATRPATKKPPVQGKISWADVLVQFGIINLALLGVVAVVYIARKIKQKSKTKVKKKRK